MRYSLYLRINNSCWYDSSDEKLNKEELRRAIAGSFIVGFGIIAVLSFVFNVLREQIIPAYIEFVGVVIGFYFGQRTAETATKTELKE